MSTVKTLSLGDRMKLYERALDTKLNPCMNYMIRLDGKNFSKLTKRWPLKKPFDKNFNEAMNAAAQSLFQLIPNIKLAWHGSDEISVWFIFPDAGNPFFDGRIQKIVSLAASKASVAFNMKFQQLIGKDIEFGIFDARIMQFPTEIEAMNCFIFRQRDCVRNSISGFVHNNGNVKDDVRYVLKDKFWKRLFALYPFDRLPLKNRVYYKIVKFDSPFIMMMLAKLQQIL